VSETNRIDFEFIPVVVGAHPDDIEAMLSGPARLEGAHTIVATYGEGSTVNWRFAEFRRYLC
jgi:hypothetical protein